VDTSTTGDVVTDPTGVADLPLDQPMSVEWCEQHFDHISQDLAQRLNPTLHAMRDRCPVAHSDQHGGFWVVTGYDNVMNVARDWETFSSDDGVGIPKPQVAVKPLPVWADPPLQRAYRRITNPHFTPMAVRVHDEATRLHVHRLIDQFIEDGACEFMDAFARPFPTTLFFEHYLNAPTDEAVHLGRVSETATTPNHPDSPAAWMELFTWVQEFTARRRTEELRGDVVDAIVRADIDGRPIRDDEIIGLVLLLILGGLDTTTGALGQFMIRFCQEPAIPQLIRDRPDLLDDAVEELLRLDGPFISIARTATRDVELEGQHIKSGDKVLFYWASANRDPSVFDDPDTFRLDRESNRHVAFGMGPHRCSGSNVARMNLRIAVRGLVDRLHNLELEIDPAEIHWHSVHNRAPQSVPISFTPGGVSESGELRP